VYWDYRNTCVITKTGKAVDEEMGADNPLSW
jgi:hypothetical protein